MSVTKNFFSKLNKSKNPIKYWRKRGMQIGKACEIYTSADFGSEPYLVSLGNHVRITSGVRFITHDGGVWVLRRLRKEFSDIDLFGKIVVGDNVHIGTDATIMPGVSIGSNCIIGCGAIVTKDIPNDSVAVGIPARVIETIGDYANKHEKEFLHTKFMQYKEKRENILNEVVRNDNTK